MEDIIQFLIIIGALFIGFVAQNKKKKRQTDEEAFPPILCYEEKRRRRSQKYRLETLIPSVSQISIDVYSPKTITLPVSVQKKPTQPSTSVTKKEASANRIQLRSPQKAREAFIYSEIFTRKYQ